MKIIFLLLFGLTFGAMSVFEPPQVSEMTTQIEVSSSSACQLSIDIAEMHFSNVYTDSDFDSLPSCSYSVTLSNPQACSSVYFLEIPSSNVYDGVGLSPHDSFFPQPDIPRIRKLVAC